MAANKLKQIFNSDNHHSTQRRDSYPLSY